MITPNCDCNYCKRRCGCMGCNGYDQCPSSHCGGCRKVDREEHMRYIIKTLEEEYTNISIDIDEIFSDCGAGLVDDSLAAEPELLPMLRRRLKRKVAELSVLLVKAEEDVKSIYSVQDKMYGGDKYYRSATEIKQKIQYIAEHTTANFEDMLKIGFKRYGELPPPSDI